MEQKIIDCWKIVKSMILYYYKQKMTLQIASNIHYSNILLPNLLIILPPFLIISIIILHLLPLSLSFFLIFFFSSFLSLSFFLSFFFSFSFSDILMQHLDPFLFQIKETMIWLIGLLRLTQMKQIMMISLHLLLILDKKKLKWCTKTLQFM